MLEAETEEASIHAEAFLLRNIISSAVSNPRLPLFLSEPNFDVVKRQTKEGIVEWKG